MITEKEPKKLIFKLVALAVIVFIITTCLSVSNAQTYDNLKMYDVYEIEQAFPDDEPFNKFYQATYRLEPYGVFNTTFVLPVKPHKFLRFEDYYLFLCKSLDIFTGQLSDKKGINGIPYFIISSFEEIMVATITFQNDRYSGKLFIMKDLKTNEISFPHKPQLELQ